MKKSEISRRDNEHYDELEAVGAIHRQVERLVLDRFIDCGDLHKDFARIFYHDNCLQRSDRQCF